MAWAEDRATWATRPERRPRDQDRRGRHEAALSFPFGIGTKAVNRSYVHQFRLLRISRHQFLHFTVNQYSLSAEPSMPISSPPTPRASAITAGSF
jgi:hypothetical protein